MVSEWSFLFITLFQEAHKLLQPADKTLKTMAIEFAEYQVKQLVLLWFWLGYDLSTHRFM